MAAPEFATALPPDLRGLVDRPSIDPVGAETFFSGLGADAIWNMVMAGSPECDLAVYRDPGFAAAYRRALAEGFAHRAAGYARDAVLAMGRWPFDLTRIAVPVDIWYGERDTSHSPDNGALLATRIPGSDRRVVPGIGGAVLWTHAEPVLTTLLERATVGR